MLHTLSLGTDDSHVPLGMGKWDWCPLLWTNELAHLVGFGSNSNNTCPPPPPPSPKEQGEGEVLPVSVKDWGSKVGTLGTGCTARPLGH